MTMGVALALPFAIVLTFVRIGDKSIWYDEAFSIAVAQRSWAWLALASTVPLAYASPGGDVGWGVKCLEYLPPLAVAYHRWSLNRAAGVWCAR